MGAFEGTALLSVTDLDGGNTEPGDPLEYLLQLRNDSGFQIPNVAVFHPIPLDTTYVDDSLSVPDGVAVIVDSEFLLLEGITLPAGGQVLVRFLVQINAPLIFGVDVISTQGELAIDANGDGEFSFTALTDGDTTQSGDQPTIIEVTAGPDFRGMTKVATHENDPDGNGLYTPGDIVRYTVRIQNDGNQETSEAFEELLDFIPDGVSYVVDSATASEGTITYDTLSDAIAWEGQIAIGEEIVLEYLATINAGLPAETTISNQGILFYEGTESGDELESTMLTDGDLNEPGRQPTVIEVGGTAVTLSFMTADDVNGGALRPGDELLYTVTLFNPSNLAVPALAFVNVLPEEVSYVPGSLVIPAGATLISETPIMVVENIALAAM
jgi:uncharacterized repeat protein (TIGR01451 family)